MKELYVKCSLLSGRCISNLRPGVLASDLHRPRKSGCPSQLKGVARKEHPVSNCLWFKSEDSFLWVGCFTRSVFSCFLIKGFREFPSGNTHKYIREGLTARLLSLACYVKAEDIRQILVKKVILAPARWLAGLVGASSGAPNWLWVLFRVRAQSWVGGSVPSQGAGMGGSWLTFLSHVMSLSFSLPLFLSL